MPIKFRSLLGLLFAAVVFTASVAAQPPHTMVLHAARLLDVETGRITAPGDFFCIRERRICRRCRNRSRREPSWRCSPRTPT